tara:strand:+ start:16219 stop:16827 length:609 start_codon:yes stop_codon:yes gene_type:complete
MKKEVLPMYITGRYGLAVYLGEYFNAITNPSARAYGGFGDGTKTAEEMLLDSGRNVHGELWGCASTCDILINCEHDGFNQIKLFDAFFNYWKYKPEKHIINISSRAAQPNISKGYLYASQKAALNHYTNNVVYNSDKACKVTTLNLGLMKHKTLPSISYEDVAETIKWILYHKQEIPEITLQHPANYQEIQNEKKLNKLNRE